MYGGRGVISVDRNRRPGRYVAAALIHRNAAMIRLTAARVPLVGLAALGLALSGCGTTMEQKAATGAVAGALVAGPVGAAVGGAAGAVIARNDKPQ
jgi:osmotically inducible lipoprotein OsmB